MGLKEKLITGKFYALAAPLRGLQVPNFPSKRFSWKFGVLVTFKSERIFQNNVQFFFAYLRQKAEYFAFR